MKTNRQLTFCASFLFVIVILSVSCNPYARAYQTAKEESPLLFVQKKNMEIIPVADFRDFDFDPDSLIAKQTERHFARLDGGNEYVRYFKGKMNLYYVFSVRYEPDYGATSNGFRTGGKSKSSSSPFFDLGLDQKLIEFERKKIEEPMRGCSPCFDVLARYDRKAKGLTWWKYTNWAAFGSIIVIGITDDPTATNYKGDQVFGALILGSIVSEVFRWTQVGMNELRLQKAVLEYNQFKY